MRIIIYTIILLLSYPSLAQNSIDFTAIDEMASNIPRGKTKNIDDLVHLLTVNAQSDIEKVRAFYVWITTNIKYDTKLIYGSPIAPAKRHKKQQYLGVLKSRKAVCEGYANLFHQLCLRSDISAEIISGYTKNKRGKVAKIGHAWNAVKIDTSWFLIDNTWGAGYINSKNQKFHPKFDEKFFLTDPNILIKSHFPRDYIFQLTESPISWADFKKKKDTPSLNEGNQLSEINFQDSINYFNTLSKEKKIINSAFRVLEADPDNNYAIAKLAIHYNKITFDKFNQFIEESNAARANSKLLNTDQIAAWKELLSQCKESLTRTKAYSKSMKAGRPDFKKNIVIKKNNNAASKNIKSMSRQIKTFEKILNRRK